MSETPTTSAAGRSTPFPYGADSQEEADAIARLGGLPLVKVPDVEIRAQDDDEPESWCANCRRTHPHHLACWKVEGPLETDPSKEPDPNAPSIEDCLRSVRADLHPWQIDRARQAFRMWLASWNGLGMKAEDLESHV